MKHCAGLDVSVKETAICIVDETGTVCGEVKVPTHPEDIARVLKDPAWRLERVGLEAGPLSQWLFEGLAKAGLPMICIETRHTKAFLKAQVNKTDRNDARGIAQNDAGQSVPPGAGQDPDEPEAPGAADGAQALKGQGDCHRERHPRAVAQLRSSVTGLDKSILFCFASSNRRGLASVRGRRDGRHLMGFEEDEAEPISRRVVAMPTSEVAV